MEFQGMVPRIHRHDRHLAGLKLGNREYNTMLQHKHIDSMFCYSCDRVPVFPIRIGIVVLKALHTTIRINS